MEIIILTGMSGAGKSRAIDVMEDLGYYCVDNMPVDMIPVFAELCMATEGRYEKTVLVADIRALLTRAGAPSFDGLLASLDKLTAMGCAYSIMFLEASDDVIIRRYKETRRRHPLISDSTTVGEAVATERALLSAVRERAGYVLDTSNLSVPRLRDQIIALFDSARDNSGIMVRVVSFGFKYGIPAESDLLFDVRFLPNPFYLPELRLLSGTDFAVWSYVASFPQTGEFMARLYSMLDFLIPQYSREGKSSLVVSVGCTGGQHRSVAVAERVGARVRELGYHSVITHRDMLKNMAELKSR